MPQGIEIYNSSGTKTFDSSESIVKFFGELNIGVSFTGSASSGSITDSRFTAYASNIPFFIITKGGFWDLYQVPQISISGNTLSWNFPGDERPDTTIIYGIY